MENIWKKCKNYAWVLPDILGDNHTTWLHLAIVLFSSYLLIFNQISVNWEYHEFLIKYEIESANETP